MKYEDMIRERKLENHQFLDSLGVFNLRQKSSRKSIKKAPRVHRQKVTPSRRSDRLLKKEPQNYADIEDVEAAFIQKRKTLKTLNPPRKKIKIENVFGAVPDVSVGTEYSTRLEASYAGIHRPPVAGIHGNPAMGCYSIALSGGYEDDVDLGKSFIYTGEGGRDLRGTKVKPKNLRTAAQSKDQVLARGNLALSRNVKNNLPVRVLRGYKLNSKYAPVEGYRYDGLYRVVEYYHSTGLSGFRVYKFRFERLEDQEPAPWSDDFQINKIGNSSNAASDKENVSDNAMEICEVAPISDEGNISSRKMELDELASVSGKENVPNNEIESSEDDKI